MFKTTAAYKYRSRKTGAILHIDGRQVLGQTDRGFVYQIIGDASLVAKVYIEDGNPEARRLAYLISHPPPDNSDAVSYACSWPSDILYTINKLDCAGFLMRKAVGVPLSEFFSPAYRSRRRAQYTFRDSYRIAVNLSLAVKSLHLIGCVIGDLSGRNVIINEDCSVTLIGSDQYQISDSAGKLLFRSGPGNDDYEAPEQSHIYISGGSLTVNQDDFSLGILLFQLLMDGVHPFSSETSGSDEAATFKNGIAGAQYCCGIKSHHRAKDITRNFEMLPKEVQQLFSNCFESGLTVPDMRPTASTWATELSGVESNLAVCPQNPRHFYSPHSAKCPWCQDVLALHVSDDSHTHIESRRRPYAWSRKFSKNYSIISPPAATVGLTAAESKRSKSKSSRWFVYSAISVTLLMLFVDFSMSVYASWSGLTQAEDHIDAARAYISRISYVEKNRLITDRLASASRYECSLALEQSNPSKISWLMQSNANRIQNLARSIELRAMVIENVVTIRNELDEINKEIVRDSAFSLNVSQAHAIRAKLLRQCALVANLSDQTVKDDPTNIEAWKEDVRVYEMAANPRKALHVKATAHALFPHNPTFFTKAVADAAVSPSDADYKAYYRR